MNTMPRRQEWGIGEYEGEESVTVRGKFEGNEPLNPNISCFLAYSMEQVLPEKLTGFCAERYLHTYSMEQSPS
jgi:hypothetical protein